MEFCPKCRNMLYIKESNDENNNLVKHCRNCEYKETYDNTKPFLVSKTNYSDDALLHDQYVNKFLRFDPTLQRINDPTIVCNNTECSNKKQVLFIKYHSRDMKFLYVCDSCGNTWKKK